MATKKSKKAEQAAAKLAAVLTQNPNGAVNRNVVRVSKDQRLVAVMCPYPDCGQEFSLKVKGDLGSYNIGGYDRHLAEVHDYHRPRPVEVWGY